MTFQLFWRHMLSASRPAGDTLARRALGNRPAAVLVVKPGMENKLEFFKSGNRDLFAKQLLALAEFVLYQEFVHD